MSLDSGAGGFILIGGALLVIAAMVVLIPQGCAAIDMAAAERKVAGAEAEAIRIESRTEQAERLAASRQQERDASHERTVEMLPYMALVLGAIFLAALVLVIVAAMFRQRQPAPVSGPIVVMLPGGMSRADHWRNLERLLASGQVSRLPGEIDFQRLSGGYGPHEQLLGDEFLPQ